MGGGDGGDSGCGGERGGEGTVPRGGLSCPGGGYGGDVEAFRSGGGDGSSGCVGGEGGGLGGVDEFVVHAHSEFRGHPKS